VADYQLVKIAHGPGWDHSRRRRDQEGWDKHAAFMDALAEDGVVLLAGPVGGGDREYVLLVVDMQTEAAIRDRLADDPWMDGVITIESVEPWSVWVGALEARHRE